MQSTTIPLLVLPKDGEMYKVLQFYGPQSKPYLRPGTEEAYSQDHESILESFAREVGVSCEKKKYPHLTGLVSILPGDSPYRLVGAGFCMMFHDRLIIRGSSLKYDISINPDHLRQLAQHHPELKYIHRCSD